MSKTQTAVFSQKLLSKLHQNCKHSKPCNCTTFSKPLQLLHLQPWRQNVGLQYKTHLLCFSFSFMLQPRLPTYGPLKYLILLIITVLCVNAFCSHEPSSSAPYLHISNTTHDVCPFCKHLKTSSPVNVDRSSLISAFCYVALYPLYVHIKMLSL